MNLWSRLIADENTFDVNLPFINFINESESSNYVANLNNKSRRPLESDVALLSRADDWTFLFDEEDNLVFPSEIAITVQRPDIVIYTSSIKYVIIIELTIPLEDCFSKACKRKARRYSNLVSDCCSNGESPCSLLKLEVEDTSLYLL